MKRLMATLAAVSLAGTATAQITGPTGRIRMATPPAQPTANTVGGEGRDRAMMQALQEQIDELRTRVENQAKTIIALQQSVNGVSAGGAGKTAALADKVGGLTGQLNTLEGKMMAFEKDFSAHRHIALDRYADKDGTVHAIGVGTTVPTKFCTPGPKGTGSFMSGMSCPGN